MVDDTIADEPGGRGLASLQRAREAREASAPKPFFAPIAFFFGVLLPVLTLAIEAVTGFCGGVFFDPIPTFGHALLVISLPVANLLAFVALRRGASGRPQWLAAACAFALVGAAYYSLLYLPISHYGAFAIVYFGMGLLPLTPLLGFIAGLTFLWSLRDRQLLGARPAKALWCGVLAGVTSILVVDGPSYIGRAGLMMATSEDPSTQQSGLALLRFPGSQQTVLRACYEPRVGMMRSTDPAGWVSGLVTRVDTSDARRAYYRMTGDAFNSVSPPRMHSRTNRDFWGEWSFDEDQGGPAVGGRVAGLKLASSRLDAHLDPKSALAYTEWSLLFRNSSAAQREARFQAQLPAGGAVSRLTLWIDGEPHEAAFGTKSQTRSAYESVVSQRRDPVLVTQNGPGRVLVQCFPVPARGEMKIRFGVTAPLDGGSGTIRLPYLVERNFTVPLAFAHTVWAQTASEAGVTSGLATLDPATPAAGGSGLDGKISDSDLAGADAWLAVELDDPLQTVWATDALGDPSSPRVLLRHGDRLPVSPWQSAVVVLDTSASMRARWQDVAEAINALARENTIRLVLASDDLNVFTGAESIRRALTKCRPRGGIDNSLALLRGLELAGEDSERTPVIWLHGPQPCLLADRGVVESSLERKLARRPIYSLQIANGADRVSELFWPLADLRQLPRRGSITESIAGILEGGESLVYSYQRLPAGEGAPQGATKVWGQLVRHWALGEVGEGLSAKRSDKGVLALRAARYQLVTPVSGAVVLENRQQFENAGLDQLDAAQTPAIPTIPEPSTGLLLLFGTMLVAMRRRR